MNAKGKLGGFVLNQAMNYISGDPAKNLPKLLNWIDGLGVKAFEGQSEVFHKVLDDPDNVWYQCGQRRNEVKEMTAAIIVVAAVAVVAVVTGVVVKARRK